MPGVTLASLTFITLVCVKYHNNGGDNRRLAYYNGYPTAWDPVKEKDQKYYAMYIRQHGVDITDPALTGMSKDALAEQVRSA